MVMEVGRNTLQKGFGNKGDSCSVSASVCVFSLPLSLSLKS